MTSDADLAVIRRAYAKTIAFLAGSADPRLVAALAEVRREDFLPPGPWALWRYGALAPTPDDDPLYLYQDQVVPILADKRLNNGQPSFVTRLIELCGVREGDRVVHIGTGSGYYTALLSRLAGPTGHVLGLEIEPDLASRAAVALAGFDNARVIEADGWTTPLGPADAILVNAGTPRFAPTWLDALMPGGRLVVPLAVFKEGDDQLTRGAIFRVVREADGYAAAASLAVSIYPCAGARDPEADAALAAALDRGGTAQIRRLVRGEPPAGADCWLRGDGWALTT